MESQRVGMRNCGVVLAIAFALAACSNNGATSGGSSGGSVGTNAGSGATSGTNGGSNGGGSSGTGGSNGTSGATCTATYSALALSPADSTVTLSGGTASPITFTVTGTRNGTTESVDASALTWTVTRTDDTDPGTIANGVYQPNPNAGGTVTVTATGCGASGSTSVTFTLNYTTQSVADGGASVGSGDFTGSVVTGDATHAPSIIYPSDQTRFPRNIYKVLFQWNRNGNDRFRVTFTGANSTVQVYTDGNDPTCAAVANAVGCWQADAATWTAIAGSNAGGTVDLEVDGTSAAGATVYASTHETLGFSKRDVPGAIFYWAASVGGIQRATVSDSQPENYLVPGMVLPNTDTVKCAACHALSRDGKYLAVSGQGTGSVTMKSGVWNTQVTPAPPPIPLQTNFASPAGDSFMAFSPDDAKLIYSARNGSQLLVLDADAGNIIASATANGAVVKGTAPDWSPSTAFDEFAFEDPNGGISTVRWDGGAGFSSPKVLAAKIAGASNGFPAYSPEGDWIAFTNNNKVLYVVPEDGGAPVELAAATTVVNNAVVTGPNLKENSMPTWAPPGDLHWLAFNSQRPYGKVTTGGNNQIWVAAIDFSRLDGGDPSYPAFRLPFQELTALNHRAYWVKDIRAEPDGGFFEPDAGPQDAGCFEGCGFDAGPCVATGDPCDLAGASCCDQITTGAYCGAEPDGGYRCVTPQFQ